LEVTPTPAPKSAGTQPVVDNKRMAHGNHKIKDPKPLFSDGLREDIHKREKLFIDQYPMYTQREDTTFERRWLYYTHF
jgi:hypothetical protein